MNRALICLLAWSSLGACQSASKTESTASTLRPAQARRSQTWRAPIRLFSGMVIIEVRDPKGGEHTFLLDTGASFSVLDKSVADDFGVQPFVASDGSTLDGKVASASGKEVDLGGLKVIKSLSVGKFVLSGEIGVYVTDLEPVRYVSGLNVEGVLGFQALQFPFTIDYPKRELRLAVAPLEASQPGVLPLSDNDTHYSPNIALSVGGKTSPTLIDTGSGECMAIPAKHAATLAFQTAPAVTGYSQNIAGVTEDRSGRLQLGVDLAGYEVAQPIIDLVATDYYRLGGSLLQNFEITFDAENQLVRFHRGTSKPAQCESVMSIGFYSGRIADKWIVALLLPGAEAIGIERGDQILSINGTEVSDLTKPEVRKLWRDDSKITVRVLRAGDELERVVPVRTLVP